MNKNALIIVITIVILVAAGIGLAKNKQNSNSSSTQATATPGPLDVGASPTSNTSAASFAATISNMAFAPATITIKKGTTVTWTNQDSVSHTVTSDTNGSGPSSTALSNGQTYSFTFDTAGTFSYHCSIHSSMKGTVVVTE